jgi:hypothetical protein
MRRELLTNTYLTGQISGICPGKERLDRVLAKVNFGYLVVILIAIYLPIDARSLLLPITLRTSKEVLKYA